MPKGKFPRGPKGQYHSLIINVRVPATLKRDFETLCWILSDTKSSRVKELIRKDIAKHRDLIRAERGAAREGVRENVRAEQHDPIQEVTPELIARVEQECKRRAQSRNEQTEGGAK